MHHILIIGAGKIGTCIAFLLAQQKDYIVYLADTAPHHLYADKMVSLKNLSYVCLNAEDKESVAEFLNDHHMHAIISALPYYRNATVAKLAAKQQIHYFDLTEDVETTQFIQQLAKHANRAFVPQCGLAPGFINIVANELMQHFQELDTVKLRVGALPATSDNALKYALTWSTDGLINEYGNLCYGIENGKPVTLQPLESLEEIEIDGLTYEAFNTSGGIGNLVQSYLGKVKHLSYKTIRYPGHCEKIKFLMNDLKLNEDRKTLKNILEHAIPETQQDVVLVYVSATGMRNNHLTEKTFVSKFYPKTIFGQVWSAIQLTTANGVCAVADIILSNASHYHGFISQEQFSLKDILNNRFGQYFAHKE